MGGKGKAAPAAGSRRRRKAAGPLPGADEPLPAPFPLEASARAEPRWSALLDPGPTPCLCAVNAAYLQLGLAVIVVARRLPHEVLCAHFVVDLLAAGVTECYGERFSPDQFLRYLGELDERVPLESCPPEVAAALVWGGFRFGLANGVSQPEALALWGRLLPAEDEARSRALERRIFGPAGRPLAVAEVLGALRPREEGAWIGDDGALKLLVREEGPTEH